VGYIWNGAAYDAFDGETPGMEGSLNALDGVWVKAFKSGAELRFAIQEGDGPGDDDVDPPEPGGWFVRLIAQSEDLRDAGNVFGQLADSSDGHDRHDLVEKPVFGERYLNVVFPHPEWGEHSGDYASDFRRLGRRPSGTWTFAVQAAATVKEVGLRWDGPEDVLSKSWLVDLETGVRQRVVPGGSYVFVSNGTTRAFKFIIGRAGVIGDHD
jgi:hypothetical protein